MILTTYEAVRPQIRQGDIIAFGGSGFISDAIKFFTHSPLSHVGIVLETKVLIDNDPQSGRIVELIESTTLDGKKGVQINRLSERVSSYLGNVWWLPLDEPTRGKINWKKFYDYSLSLVGRPYNYLGVGGMILEPASRWPIIGRLVTNPRDASELFCSALDSAVLEASGGLNPDVNYSEVSPQDLAEFQIFSQAIQIKGQSPGVSIPRFNSRQI